MEKAYTDRVQAPTKWRESLNSRLLSYRSHIRPFSSLSLLFCASSLRSANPRGVLTARKRFPRFSTLGLTSHPVAGKRPSENATACWYFVKSIAVYSFKLLEFENKSDTFYLFIYLFYSMVPCFSSVDEDCFSFYWLNWWKRTPTFRYYERKKEEKNKILNKWILWLQESN